MTNIIKKENLKENLNRIKTVADMLHNGESIDLDFLSIYQKLEERTVNLARQFYSDGSYHIILEIKDKEQKLIFHYDFDSSEDISFEGDELLTELFENNSVKIK